jgi:hypothetical protein
MSGIAIALQKACQLSAGEETEIHPSQRRAWAIVWFYHHQALVPTMHLDISICPVSLGSMSERNKFSDQTHGDPAVTHQVRNVVCGGFMRPILNLDDHLSQVPSVVKADRGAAMGSGIARKFVDHLRWHIGTNNIAMGLRTITGLSIPEMVCHHSYACEWWVTMLGTNRSA